MRKEARTDMLRKTLEKLFGPLSPCPMGYYGEIAEETLQTDEKLTPLGLRYRVVFMLGDARDDEPAYFMADFWWYPPLMKSSMCSVQFPGERFSIFTTEAEAEKLHETVETKMVAHIEAEHFRMVTIG